MSTLHAGYSKNGKMAWCLGCQEWLKQDHPFWAYDKRVALHEHGTGHAVQWKKVDFTQGWELVLESSAPQPVPPATPPGDNDAFPHTL